MKPGLMIQMASTAEEEAVGGIVERLGQYVAPYKLLLGQGQQRLHLGHMIHGLVSDLERKSAEPIAILQGLPRRVLQNFLGLCQWDWEPLRRRQRQEVSKEIGTEDGMLILDGCAVPKKGKETVGVSRQWCGRLGKVDNCVVGVHAAYVGRDGQTALVESRLFLPEAWAGNPIRRKKVHVPEEVKSETKIEIAQDMVKHLAMELPFKWITADEEFGRSTSLRDGIRACGKYYGLEVPRNTFMQAVEGTGSRKRRRADDLAKLVCRERPMTRILVAYGEKQPIEVDAFMVQVNTFRGTKKVTVRETLLCTVDACGDKHFYLAHLPIGTSLTTAVRKACLRHRIEEVFAEAKGDVGMDHFECRAWHGWHHHMTLVQMAHWFLVREQLRLGKKNPRCNHQHAPAGGCKNHNRAVDSSPHTGMAGVPAYAQ